MVFSRSSILPSILQGSKKLPSRENSAKQYNLSSRKSPIKSPAGNRTNSLHVTPMKVKALSKGSRNSPSAHQGFEVSPPKQQRNSPTKKNVASPSQFCIGPLAPQAQQVLDLDKAHSQSGPGEARRCLEFTIPGTHDPAPTSLSWMTSSHTPYPTPAPTPLSLTSSHTPYPTPVPTPSLSQSSCHTFSQNPAHSHPSVPSGGYSPSLPSTSQNYDQQYFRHPTYPNYPNFYDCSNSPFGNYYGNNFTH